jgi:adenine phosphoribosyltransferase
MSDPTALADRVRAAVREIPDFPTEGIMFKDITPVLQDGELFSEVTEYFAERCRDRGINKVVGIESRGFIFGAALAHELSVGLTLVRKPGKLPYDLVGVDYELEYGTDRVEMHVDGIDPNDRVVLIDDLLATGGTAAAAAKLVDRVGGEIVEAVFLIELGFLNGREKLGDMELHSLVKY